GRAREMVNRIQKTRKDIGLNVTDRIVIAFEADNDLAKAATTPEAYIKTETLADTLKQGTVSDADCESFTFEIDDMTVRLAIRKV
ncbi:MAG: DUF5915 domain-containing protein, partial [Pseudomonadales bacterium]